MTREQATTEATQIATTDGIRMVVTFNPYGEEPDAADRYGYCPAAAARIFAHEEVVATIETGS